MLLEKSLEQASVFIPQIAVRHYSPRLFSLCPLSTVTSVNIGMYCRRKVPFHTSRCSPQTPQKGRTVRQSTHQIQLVPADNGSGSRARRLASFKFLETQPLFHCHQSRRQRAVHLRIILKL